MKKNLLFLLLVIISFQGFTQNAKPSEIKNGLEIKVGAVRSFIDEVRLSVQFPITKQSAIRITGGSIYSIPLLESLTRSTATRFFYSGFIGGMAYRSFLTDTKNVYADLELLYRAKSYEDKSFLDGGLMYNNWNKFVNLNQSIQSTQLKLTIGRVLYYKRAVFDVYTGIGIKYVSSEVSVVSYDCEDCIESVNEFEDLPNELKPYYANGNYFIPSLHAGLNIGLFLSPIEVD